jgi:hypothetical protein
MNYLYGEQSMGLFKIQLINTKNNTPGFRHSPTVFPLLLIWIWIRIDLALVDLDPFKTYYLQSRYIFHVKIQLFVPKKSGQDQNPDPDLHGSALVWLPGSGFGSAGKTGSEN